MAPPPGAVAPNDVQPLFTSSQRVPLGPSGHRHYAATLGPGGAGHYWFYVPTSDPGRVIITLEGGSSEIRLESETGAHLAHASGQTLGHDLPLGSVGVYHVFVTPVRPAQVRFITEGWPREKDGSPLIPWNFWYYPFNPSAGKKGTFDSAAVQRSAMEKFDRAFLPDRMGAAWGWEKNNHVDPKAAGWEGHCDMASFASVYFEDPPEKATVNGVTFTREELRLLATEWAGRRMPGTAQVFDQRAGAGYATVDGKPVVGLLKPSEAVTPSAVMRAYDRCYPHATAESRRKAAGDSAKLDPEKVAANFGDLGRRYLEFLIDYVRVGGRPVLGDFGPTDPARVGIEVWNFALVLFVAEWKELPLTTPDPRACAVRLDVVTNVDGWPGDAPLPPAVVGASGRPEPVAKNHLVFRHELELRYRESGVPDRARFSSVITSAGEVYAPRVLLDVPKPGAPRQDANPFINDELLKAGKLRLRELFKP